VLNKLKFKSLFVGVLLMMLSIGISLMIPGCGKEKIITRYQYPPDTVSLISPMADSTVTAGSPIFIWHKLAGASHYNLQVSKTIDFLTPSINSTISDTMHQSVTHLYEDIYYWRVRGQDLYGVWGDWSNCQIRIFYRSDYTYLTPLVQMYTNGQPQDLYVRGDSAYVADGQADLSIYNITNRANPIMVLNINPGDNDHATATFVVPLSWPEIDTFPFAYVADMNGKIQALNTKDPASTLNISFGTNQNLQEIEGTLKSDTLWILAVSSGFNRRKLAFYKIIYDPSNAGGPNPYSYFYEMNMPADAFGVFADSQFAYVACGSSGLIIVNIVDIYNPFVTASMPLGGGIANSVFVRDSLAYVTDDRAGLFIIELGNDRLNPRVAKQINTTGRAQDVHAVGNYAFLADGSGGLKVIDTTIPDSSHIVASYVTPYALGVWADARNVFVCDRDRGLYIYTNNIP
jgi:hypothetical protein